MKLVQMQKFWCLFFTFLLFANKIWASSCCGSSISIPAMITTGERWKFQTVLSQSERIFQITPDSEAIKLSEKNQLEVFKTQIKAGYRFDNNWQAFGQIYYFDRGSGDLDFGLGRELDLSNDIQSYAWTQLTIPTGKSIYEITDVDDEPTGSGFWTPGIGMSVTNILGLWDVSGTAYLGHGITRKIKGTTITPGLKSLTQVAIGRSIGDWRVGSSLEYQRENGKKVKAASTADDSFSWPVSLSVSYINNGDIWTAIYSDETLLGPTQNTYLNRGISVSYIKRLF